MLDSLSAQPHPQPPLVIVCTTGTGGDIQPFIAVAQGLYARGHSVVLLVPGFQEGAAKAAELPYETFGTAEQFQAALNDPLLWDERKGWGVVWNAVVPHLSVLHKLVQRLPADQSCVILSHPLLVPMAAMARAVRPDLPIVATYLAPSNVCSSHDLLTAGSLRIPPWVPLSWRRLLWRFIHKGWIDPVCLPSLNAARAQHQLPPVPHFFEHMLKEPNASVGLFPDWFAAVQPDWPHPFSPGIFPSAAVNKNQVTALPPELEHFLTDGDPPIVFTPGTGHQHAANYFLVALEALKRLGRRGLFITTHAAQVPHTLPPTVMWQAHIPFTVLLPRAAAVVHHGGIGTTAEAYRAGTPQLVVPFAYDQFDNALRSQRLGVADVLPAKRLTVRRMTRQLAKLLSSDDISNACRTVATNMTREPDMAWMLDRIEAAMGIGPD